MGVSARTKFGSRPGFIIRTVKHMRIFVYASGMTWFTHLLKEAKWDKGNINRKNQAINSACRVAFGMKECCQVSRISL